MCKFLILKFFATPRVGSLFHATVLINSMKNENTFKKLLHSDFSEIHFPAFSSVKLRSSRTSKSWICFLSRFVWKPRKVYREVRVLRKLGSLLYLWIIMIQTFHNEKHMSKIHVWNQNNNYENKLLFDQILSFHFNSVQTDIKWKKNRSRIMFANLRFTRLEITKSTRQDVAVLPNHRNLKNECLCHRIMILREF